MLTENEPESSRRDFVRNCTIAAAASLVMGGSAAILAEPVEEKKKAGEEIKVLPTEDLMREHGILRRILFVYRDCSDKLQGDERIPRQALTESAEIIRSFIEDYHEKLEEDHLFPLFRKANRLVDLTNVLQRQHQAGREVTRAIMELSRMKGEADGEAHRRLIRLILAFIRMYNPHAAREDTVLFPALHEIVTPAEYDALGEQFEDKEKQLFGEGGFEKMVDRVAEVEKTLGIYDLAQFTPPQQP